MSPSALTNKRRVQISGIIVVLAVLIIAYQQWSGSLSRPPVATLALLLPDDARLNDPKVQIWQQTAREEGILLEPLRDSEFLDPWFDRRRLSGIIVPDQVHRVASDTLIDTLAQYTAGGGHVMLVYDAGIWTPAQRYAQPYSRFSTLAGVNYADYTNLKERLSQWTPVLGSAAVFDALQVPPGKYALYEDMREYARTAPVQRTLIEQPLHALAGYDQPVLSYDVFATAGDYRGEVLLQTPQGGVAAGVNAEGKGQVLFVNLPLAYLKIRTDGLLMHGFMRYFAEQIVQLPRLAGVPDGVGGLVMNWHADSNVSLAALKKMSALGFLRQGPYSVHITAGPDAVSKGDRAGLDVERNEEIQSWIETFVKKGYAIGSHGGWIHDYWGNKVPDEPTDEFVEYLRRNKQAIETVAQQPVTEYSAPEGNHPRWVNDWLHENGFLAYYSAGNSGMPPTRSYRGGQLRYPELWSFPIVTYRDMAGFEELQESGVAGDAVSDWLREISDFGVRHHTVRLIYFHPRGALLYPAAMRAWLAHTRKLNEQAQFNWYTLSGLSRFLNRRLHTTWQVSLDDNRHRFVAGNEQGLAGHCWLLDKARYGQPDVWMGEAQVIDGQTHWLVKAGAVNRLEFRAGLTGAQ